VTAPTTDVATQAAPTPTDNRARHLYCSTCFPPPAETAGSLCEATSGRKSPGPSWGDGTQPRCVICEYVAHRGYCLHGHGPARL
jgi:hypothetical protein